MSVKLLKENISKEFATLGHTPSFYSEAQAEKIKHVVSFMTGGRSASALLNMNSDLFTLHPNIKVPPASVKVRPCESFGFTRLDLMSFFLRGTTLGVLSCHNVTVNSRYFPLGQLGYITNPYWACYGVYSKEMSKPSLNKSGMGLFKHSDLTTPNLLATFNALLCYDANNRPSIMLSRIYGDGSNSLYLTRAIDYFSTVLNLNVYVVETQRSIVAYLGQSPSSTCVVLKSPTVKPLVTLSPDRELAVKRLGPYAVEKLKTFERFGQEYIDARLMPYRYCDIEGPKEIVSKNSEETVVYERHRGYLLRTALSNRTASEAIIARLPDDIKGVCSLTLDIKFQKQMCRITGRPIQGYGEVVVTSELGPILKTVYDANEHGTIILD